MYLAQLQLTALQPLLIAVIVITVLNLLLSFLVLSRLGANRETAQPALEGVPVNTLNAAPQKTYAGKGDINGEVAAAISAALHMYKNDVHDFENTVLTINKVAKSYSPWSSKIYGLRKNPR